MGIRENIYGSLAKHIAEGNASQVITRTQNSIPTSNISQTTFKKYIILDVIINPNELVNNLEAYAAQFGSLGVINLKKMISVLPRNSVIAQPIEIDGGGPPVFLLPFFPSHIALPCKPGELVWALFDNQNIKNNVHGYWISRIPDFMYVDDVNHSHHPRRWDASMLLPGARDLIEGTSEPTFEFRNGVVRINEDGERVTIPETQVLSGDDKIFENIIQNSNSGKLAVHEAIPRYNKRPHDIAFEGSNNTLIVLGTDRSGPVANFEDSDGIRNISLPEDDLTNNSGMIDFVAGRGQTTITSGKKVTNSLETEELDKSLSNVFINEGDPDYKNDRSRILVSMGSGKVFDKRLGNSIDELYTTIVAPDNSKISTVDSYGVNVIKSDTVRVIARSDIMLVSTNYDVKDNKIVERDNYDDCACVVLKPNGDIIIKPSKNGVVKIGGEDADRAILCSAEPASSTEGIITHSPIISTMGGAIGTSVGGQGTYSTKILVK